MWQKFWGVDEGNTPCSFTSLFSRWHLEGRTWQLDWGGASHSSDLTQQKSDSAIQHQHCLLPNAQKACQLDGLLALPQLWTASSRHTQIQTFPKNTGLSGSTANTIKVITEKNRGTMKWYIQSCPNSFLDTRWCENSAINMQFKKNTHKTGYKHVPGH